MKRGLKSTLTVVLTVILLIGGTHVLSAGAWKNMKVYEDPTINYFRNDQKVNVSGSTLFINDTTYLPVRALTDMLGIDIRWNGQERAIYVTDGGSVVDQSTLNNYISTIALREKEIKDLKEKVKDLEDSKKKLEDEIKDLKKKRENTPHTPGYGNFGLAERNLAQQMSSYYYNGITYPFTYRVFSDGSYQGQNGWYTKDSSGVICDLWGNKYYSYTSDSAGNVYDEKGRHVGYLQNSYNPGYGAWEVYYKDKNGNLVDSRGNYAPLGSYEYLGIVYDKNNVQIGVFREGNWNNNWYGGYVIELTGSDSRTKYTDIDLNAVDFRNHLDKAVNIARNAIGSYPSKVIVKDSNGSHLKTYSVDRYGRTY